MSRQAALLTLALAVAAGLGGIIVAAAAGGPVDQSPLVIGSKTTDANSNAEPTRSKLFTGMKFLFAL